MPISVLIAEDHQIVRDGLKALLVREGFDVVGEARNGQEAVQLAAACHPDIALLDLSMPVMNGLDALKDLARTSPNTRAVLLTRHDLDEYVLAAVRAGAKGFVLKSQSTADLLQAIAEVHAGGIYISPGVSKVMVNALLSRSPSDERLTTRERQVVKLVAEGHSTKQVANLLGISVKTAESHRTRLMQKLDIHATAGLVTYAYRHGLVEL
jgi:DNA-binding NarL/FixJ family response regulator